MSAQPWAAAARAVDDLFEDLNDRRGLHLDTLDKGIQREIRDKWRGIVERAIRSCLPEGDEP